MYGIADDLSDGEIKEVAGLLQAKGLLRKDSYASLSLTPVGRAFLKNRENLTLTRAKRGRTGSPHHPRPGARVAQTGRATVHSR